MDSQSGFDDCAPRRGRKAAKPQSRKVFMPSPFRIVMMKRP